MIGLQVGNYIIESELGKGGMGMVYRAHHIMLGRPAAVKVLLPQYSATPEIVQRFFNEAKAATSIRHLGIVEIYDFGVMSSGLAFIAMELLSGESLAARISKHRMSLKSSLATIRQICGALSAAHDAGIVHRDLKPDNVFMIPDAEVPGGERIKLLDFGIAKVSEETSGMINQTRTGTVIGTPRYMAPEQCRGVKIDHRADIYALGCIFYELIAGRPPFSGEGSGDVLAAHIYATPDPIERVAPTTPTVIARLVHWLLAKNPADRPQTARQMIEEIDRLDVNVSSEVPQDPAVAPSFTHGMLGSTLPLSTVTQVERPRASARNGAPPAADVLSIGATTLTQAAASSALRREHDRRSGRAIKVGAAALAGGAVVTLAIWGLLPRDTNNDVGHPSVASYSNPDAESMVPLPVTDAATRLLDAGTIAVTDLDADVAIDALVAATTVQVRLDSIPHGAHIWLDGVEIGVTPYTGTLPKSKHTVVFSLRRELYYDQIVETNTNKDIHANVRLAPRRAAAPSTVVRPPVQVHTPIGDDDTPNPLSPH